MRLPNFITSKITRLVGGTILLGAVGSGAWEWVLKPSLLGVSRFVLSIGTLGITAFKDSLYQEIAKGLHEEGAVMSSFYLLSALPLGFSVVGLSVAATMRLLIAKGELSDSSRSLIRITRRFVSIGVLLLLLTTVISLIEVNQLAYIDGAISHFRRLLAITAPYMPAETRLMYESRFAQIASSEDYVALERDLQGICHGKSLKCPSFSVW